MLTLEMIQQMIESKKEWVSDQKIVKSAYAKAKEVFEQNKAKGFHDKEQSNETLLMLVITELAEAVEADRKGDKAQLDNFVKFNNWFKSKRFEINEDWAKEFELYIKDTVEDKLADAVIRLLYLAGKLNNGSEYHRNIDLSKGDDYYISVKRRTSFPDKIYNIISWLTYSYASCFRYVNTGISIIEKLCFEFSIDLWLHVELKMKYNQTRP